MTEEEELELNLALEIKEGLEKRDASELEETEES